MPSKGPNSDWPVNSQLLTELPLLDELSLDELMELPDETRHYILMRAGKEFSQVENDQD